jgi:hypothetical protein
MMHHMDLIEAVVGEGDLIGMDVALQAMSRGYIVEGVEDRIDGFRVFDDIETIYEECEYIYD